MREILPPGRAVYYVGDDREGSLQRASLAVEIGRLLPGFERVTYPDWDALLARWWQTAPPGTVLALDEFPSLVAVAQELPSLLQKYLDREAERGVHVLLSGSSRRRMQEGLVLDRSAPLFGRASEILKISPLPAGWIEEALYLPSPERAIEAYAVWGGTPSAPCSSAPWASSARSRRACCSTTCETPPRRRRSSPSSARAVTGSPRSRRGWASR